MNKSIYILLVSFSLISSAFGQRKIEYSEYLDYDNKDYFINGLNVAWNKFGGDFGRHDVWGNMYDSTAFDEIFANCEAHGVNVVRLWIHCDGRANPDFNKEGYCTGFDTDFFLDMDNCFRQAKNHNVMIMPCMWSFDMCKDARESAGAYAGAHDDLLTNNDKMDSYIEKAFIPLVKRYANQCNLFAWEVCNEPEWALDRQLAGFMNYETDSTWTYRTKTLVPVETMQRLTAKMAEVVHTYSNKMVTTGSSALRWNSDVAPAVKNIWSDASLQKVYNKPLAYLDFYQVHYYDYMVPMQADPFDSARTTDYWKFDKPIIIGECPASAERCKVHTPDEQIKLAKQNGYAGIMFWSYNGDDGVGKWDDFKDALKRNYEADPEHLYMDQCPCKKLDASKLAIAIKAKGKKTVISWNDNDPVYAKNYSISYGSSDSFKKKSISKIGKQNRVKVKGKFEQLQVAYTDIYGYTQTSEWMTIESLKQ